MNNGTILKRLLATLIMLSVSAFAQGQTKTDFALFSQRQDSLFLKAYELKDVGRYRHLLDEFLVAYDGLDSIQKKNYSSRLVNAYYNFACIHSLSNRKDLAFEFLEKAIVAGYCDYVHLHQDQDLDNIRNEVKFKSLVEPLRAIGDYLFILRKAGEYDKAQLRDIPKFSYQSAEDSNLIELRKSFKLDSVAGGGNEISRILNLLHWVHNEVRHDGTHENPLGRNAANLLTVCRREGRGLNCRGLATVLNECYLSLGFKSRFVGCLPKDSLGLDPDSHVINLVYSESLKKWLWVDPTNDAYVMNEKGELLSIEEVRDRIVHDRPLILNPDANWNHKSSTTKEDYLYRYMAKNLYKLSSPVESRYNLETRQPGKVVRYVELLPLECLAQQPVRSEKTDTLSRTTFVWYKTNNPQIFWARPE